jgi:hypothetical protein
MGSAPCAGNPHSVSLMMAPNHTICTAVAPDAVFTVRSYVTKPLYGAVCAQIRFREASIRRSVRCVIGQVQNLAQVR